MSLYGFQESVPNMRAANALPGALFGWPNAMILPINFAGNAKADHDNAANRCCSLIADVIILPLRKRSPDLATSMFAGYFSHINYS